MKDSTFEELYGSVVLQKAKEIMSAKKKIHKSKPVTLPKTQVGGDHYTRMCIQPWDAFDSWLTHEQFIGYLLGTAIAYLARFNVEDSFGKGGLSDIQKAEHCLQKLIEVMQNKQL